MNIIKSGFDPDHFVLRKGIPVKWIIDGKRIVVPKLGLEFDVKEDVHIIEFMPNGHVAWPIQRDC